MRKTEIQTYEFNENSIEALGSDTWELNWPVVYQLFNDSLIYVGETTNLKARMKQHVKIPQKQSLTKFSAIYDNTYNKSVVLDLESQLIQWFSGDGKYKMLNQNIGQFDREYYNRKKYSVHFADVWKLLRDIKVAEKTITEIENSGLFKFSPYKRLNEDQIKVVSQVMEELKKAFESAQKTISVITGEEGTGKSIVLMFMAKLVCDIQDCEIQDDEPDLEDYFEIYFRNPVADLFKDKSVAMVIPNQSLKGSISKIFKGIINMGSVDLLSPLEFGLKNKAYDLTFIDEAHLLKISNQEVHKKNRQKFEEINKTLFSDNISDHKNYNQLDWNIQKSNHVVMVYADQRVRQNCVTLDDLNKYTYSKHVLRSQMRSIGGKPFIKYLKSILSDKPPREKQVFPEFEFKLFENFKQFVENIEAMESEYGLSRLVAGFAWEWKSKKNKNEYDICIDEIKMRWNSTLNDFVGSEQSKNEVGSIYTIQGNDLNYCGVIIGEDLRYCPKSEQFKLDRNNYKDRGAKKRTHIQLKKGDPLTDDDLLDQVLRTYRILMNRSVKGTFVYACDSGLRDYLKRYLEVVELPPQNSNR